MSLTGIGAPSTYNVLRQAHKDIRVLENEPPYSVRLPDEWEASSFPVPELIDAAVIEFLKNECRLFSRHSYHGEEFRSYLKNLVDYANRSGVSPVSRDEIHAALEVKKMRKALTGAFLVCAAPFAWGALAVFRPSKCNPIQEYAAYFRDVFIKFSVMQEQAARLRLPTNPHGAWHTS